MILLEHEDGDNLAAGEPSETVEIDLGDLVADMEACRQRELRRVAHHEAGHIVAMWHYGVRELRAWIGAGGLATSGPVDEHTAAAARDAHARASVILAGDLAFANALTGDRAARLAQLERGQVTVLAGPLAEAQHTGCPLEQVLDEGGRTDHRAWRLFQARIGAMVPVDDAADMARHTAIAAGILESYAPAVAALAEALVQRRRLEPSDVLEVLRAA